MPKNEMSKSDAARIQGTQAIGGKDMGPGGFAARAQGAADRNANANQSNTSTSNTGSSNTGGNSGKTR